MSVLAGGARQSCSRLIALNSIHQQYLAPIVVQCLPRIQQLLLDHRGKFRRKYLQVLLLARPAFVPLDAGGCGCYVTAVDGAGSGVEVWDALG